MDNSVSKDALRMREYRKSQQYKDKDKENERREKRKLYKRRKRLEKGCTPIEIIKLRTAINNIPKPLTVLDLIKKEQKNYWIQKRKTNEGKAEYQKHLYYTNITNNIMHKEKTQRNKFKNFGNYVEHISPQKIINRFALFNNCCAYCGSSKDIQIEHVIPASKHGPHCMANIIPACKKCNSSKYNYDMVTWYKQQTFYTKERLNKIKDILSSTPYPVKQIDLFPEWMIIN